MRNELKRKQEKTNQKTEKKRKEKGRKKTKDSRRKQKNREEKKKNKIQLKWSLCNGRLVCVVTRPVCVIADRSTQKRSPILALWTSLSGPTGLRVAYRNTQKTPQSQTSLQNSRPVYDCDLLGVFLCAMCKPVGSCRPV